jgi:hypothetical protein
MVLVFTGVLLKRTPNGQRYGEGGYDARGSWSLVFLIHSLDILRITIGVGGETIEVPGQDAKGG